MQEEPLKKKAVNGVIWSSIDRFSTQGIQFVFSILIARLLMPSDYGVVAMLVIFLAVSQTFIDSGFGTALVQKSDRTETDFSTVFYFNIVVAILFYILLWLSSPYIASFYDIPMLKDVTRVVALTLVFSALGGIQNAKLSIAINFKTRAIISLISALSTGCIGFCMAYSGYGAWALVFQMVFSSLLNTILLWCFVRWIPKLVFSWQSFRQLFSFGSKLLASALLDTIYNNVYTLVIGKVITGVLQGVTFPVLCSIQNDENRLVDAYKRFIRMSAFIIFPLMIGLSAVAAPFIRVVLTDKWEGAIYLLQIVCFSLMWYPIHAINLSILQVKGRSDYFLKLEIIKKIQGVCILCLTVPIGIVAMCYGSVVSSLLSLIWNTYYTKRLIGYGFFSQIKDLSHILIHSLVMGGIVMLVIYFIDITWVKLLVGILVGGFYYVAGAYIMRFEELKEVLSIIKRK